jgi:hypothetical protein
MRPDKIKLVVCRYRGPGRIAVDLRAIEATRNKMSHSPYFKADAEGFTTSLWSPASINQRRRIRTTRPILDDNRQCRW